MTTSHHDHSRTPGRPRANTQDLPLEQTILYTASRLFMEQGYEPVSLMQIAKACGVTKASVYYYFSNKAHFICIVNIRIRQSANRQTVARGSAFTATLGADCRAEDAAKSY